MRRTVWTSLPSIRWEADAAHRFVKVEMMKDGSGDETDQHRCTICLTQTWSDTLGFCSRPSPEEDLNCKYFVPSSTTIARLPSGERPTQVIFFVVENGNVSDVLLQGRD